jgi:flagellar biosynthesis chaperone FliJ
VNPLTYPLEQLMTIKKNRFDQAVKLLEEKKKLLEQAHARLHAAMQERDEVSKHKTDKIDQMRQALDAGVSSTKIQQMKVYVKVVQEQLDTKEKVVIQKQQEVNTAQQQVDLATQELFQRKKDLEKLEIHKAEWEKQVRVWTERKEGLEGDELGSAAFARKNQSKNLSQ